MSNYSLAYRFNRYKGGVSLPSNNFERVMKEQVGTPLTEMNSKETLEQINQNLDKLVKVLTPPPPKEKTIWDYAHLFVYAALGIGIVITFYSLGFYNMFIPLP